MFFIFCRRRSKTQYGKLCEKQISVVRSGFLGEKMELYVLKCAIIVVFRGSAANPRWDIVALHKIIKLILYVIWLLPGQRDPARNGSHCGVVLLGSGKRAPVWNVVKHDLTLFALVSYLGWYNWTRYCGFEQTAQMRWGIIGIINNRAGDSGGVGGCIRGCDGGKVGGEATFRCRLITSLNSLVLKSYLGYVTLCLRSNVCSRPKNKFFNPDYIFI